MKTFCLYLHIHQPFRLRTYRFFDIGSDSYYYDDYKNKSIIQKLARKSYLPTNQILLDLIHQHGNDFKVNFSISGTTLDQLEMYAPEVLDSFKALAQTGNVEFLAETYNNSLASLKSKSEFANQVRLHSQRIEQLFGLKTKVFHNSEMIYDDRIGELVYEMGFSGMLSEGAKHILGWRSPHYLYFNPLQPDMKILLRNYNLSDDIAFRFSSRGWSEWPLTTEKFIGWLNRLDAKEKQVNVLLSYDTFGEHHGVESGIFEFLKALPNTIKNISAFKFAKASEAIETQKPIAALHVPFTISWADAEKDLTAWLGNELQEDAFNTLYALKPLVEQIQDPEIQRDWLYLQSCDHFYNMSTKYFSDGSTPSSAYDSPYEAFINYMNVLNDFIDRVKKATPTTKKKFEGVLVAN
jgi:alpha-amylase